MNAVLSITIRFFACLEKFDSQTAFKTHVATNLTISMFINTALMPMIIYREELYGSDSLIVEAYNIVIANAI